MRNKDIILGIGEDTYNGVWSISGSKLKGRVIFTFDKKLPAPYNSRIVKIPYQNLKKLTPYDMGGQIVNKILECEKQ